MTYRFGDFEVDSGRFVLLRRGRAVRIEPKPLRLLLHLLERHPEAVSKDELLDALWPDAVVTEGSLIRAVREVRRSLRERADGAGIVRTVRGRGYAIGVDVERVDDRAPAAAAPATDFVGREAALAALDAAAGHAIAGRGRVVLVRGEAGIGKSRLLAEFGLLARERGVPVFATWCPEDESEPPFWPWTQLLRQLVREGRLAEAALSEVSPLFPASTDGGQESSRGSEARFQLFESVSRLLADAARETGLLLVIDDLHGADDDTLQLLEFATREIASARIVLALGERDPGGAKRPTLTRALAQAARQPYFEEIRLEGLAPEQLGELAERLGTPDAAAAVEDIATRSGGNPFYARELLRASKHAVRPGSDGVSAGEAREPGTIPSSVRDVLRARLSRLSDVCNDALAAGSVIGREFSIGVLTRATESARPAVETALAEAVDDGLLRTSADTYRFDHALVREVILAEQGAGRLGTLHRQVAAALESDPFETNPGALAHHLNEAGQGIDPSRIVRTAMAAGDRANRMLAFGSAFSHFDRALEALARFDDPEPELRSELLIRRGHARLSAGHVIGHARADFVEAAAIARTARDDDLLARAALGFQSIPSNFPFLDPVVSSLLEEAFSAVQHREDEATVRLLCRLAPEFYYTDRRAEAEALAERGEALAAKLAVPQLQALAIQAKLFVSMGQIDPRDRLDLARQGIGYAEKANEGDLMAYTRGAAFQFRLECGDPAAGDELAAIETVIDRHHLARGRINLMRYRAALRFLSGDLDAAQEQYAEAFGTARDLGAGAILVLCAAGVSLCMREKGQHAMVVGMLEPMRKQMPENKVYRSAIANAYAMAGRLDDARRELADLISDGVAAIPRDGNYLPMLVSLAEVCHAVGDAVAARSIGDALEPHAEWFVVGGETSVCMGSAARYLAMSRETQGDAEAATRWHAIAEEANLRAGALHWARKSGGGEIG